MKKVLFLFTLLIGLTVSAQEGEMRINMWYGTINNSDVEEHLVLEKHFKSIWKQQKDAGLLTKWEMWNSLILVKQLQKQPIYMLNFIQSKIVKILFN